MERTRDAEDREEVEDREDREEDKIERAVKRIKTVSTDTLYLDTINRHLLDFDLDRLCSMSLSPLNLYACLVCGKYLQGKSSTSHAYYHALQTDHHVYIHLDTLRLYILPEGYQVDHPSFDDIKKAIYPQYTKASIALLDAHPLPRSKDLLHKPFIPGYIGLSNFKMNDYVNVSLQLLAHCRPLRDHFLLTPRSDTQSSIVDHFGLLLRKIWNKDAFKSHCAPQSLLQDIYQASKKRFEITKQSDPMDFLVWFLNALKSSRKDGGLVSGLFQGKVREKDEKETQKSVPFMFLTLDLPQIPLFQDEFERNIIPQVALDTLLKKYDGHTPTYTANLVKRYAIVSAPKFLVLHMKRFERNAFAQEKNCTMVTFPLSGLNLPVVTPSTPIPFAESIEVDEKTHTEGYNLVASICHEGTHASGKYSVYVASASGKTWFRIEDLDVEEVGAQQVFLSEAYIQVWEKVE